MTIHEEISNQIQDNKIIWLEGIIWQKVRNQVVDELMDYVWYQMEEVWDQVDRQIGNKVMMSVKF